MELKCEFNTLSPNKFSRQIMYKCLILLRGLVRKASLLSFISSFVASLKYSCIGLTQMPYQNPSKNSDLWEVFILQNEHLLSAVFTALKISWMGLFNGSEAMTKRLHHKGAFWQRARRPQGHTSDSENPKSMWCPHFSHQQVIDKMSAGWACS